MVRFAKFQIQDQQFKFFSLILIAVLAKATGEVCQSYQCATDRVQMQKDQCIRTDYEEAERHTYIKPCTPRYKCIMDNTQNGSCYLQPAKFPNRQLQNQQLKVQQYTLIGEDDIDCQKTSDCNQDQFCNSTTYKCQDLKQVGEECKHDSDCVLYAGCDIQIKAGAIGECREYLSGTFGQIIQQCSTGTDKVKGNMNVNLYLRKMDYVQISWFCQSGQCSIRDGYAICIDPLTTYNGSSFACSSVKDYCVATTDFSQQIECQCGRNPKGTSYCNEFFGDPLGQKFIRNGKK